MPKERKTKKASASTPKATTNSNDSNKKQRFTKGKREGDCALHGVGCGHTSDECFTLKKMRASLSEKKKEDANKKRKAHGDAILSLVEEVKSLKKSVADLNRCQTDAAVTDTYNQFEELKVDSDSSDEE